jgi:glycosyltransferase involved in cell wall biosynthesis
MKVFFPTYYERTHSLYKEMITNPPKGCEYITREGEPEDIYKKYYHNDANRILIDFILKASSLFISPTYLRGIIERNENTQGADIVYSMSGKFYLGELPWIIDCETVDSFYRGYKRLFPIYKRQIEKILSKENCKKIMPWTDKAKESILVNLDTSNFENKIEVVPLTIPSTPIDFLRPKDCITFLFVGSSNFQFWKDFYFKGGLEAIKAFQQISYQYDNIQLIVRSWVDDRIRKIVHKSEKISIVDNILPRNELDKLYQNASVFVYPSFMTPAMAFVEAMNYYLPIITTDYWANSEYVNKYHNGFLVSMPKTVKHREIIKCTHGYPRDIGYHKVDENQINEISESMKYFVEKPKEIERMGKNAKKMVETGRYSMEKKNKQLMRICEECLKR